ncbi:LysE family transporter [Corynebacterium sp. TAE3-ERU12]|uniref:LysE family translocator n=1 Tax=Corynebacterium sp. TAE3-ERU12 TaxID=2849491 RepID=UPI001C46B32A|nr:LysE family transporter [Corynebacterium sp. TAE3-ERU12]MBV7296079.1 LysE family transporter [Corynebacterium sp. TAE3-ERU12]
MTWSDFGLLMFINFVGMASPGPDLVLVLRLAARSRRHALAAVMGIVTSLVLWISLTVFGLAAVLAAQPALFGVISVLGASYLAWAGYSALRAGITGVRELSAGATPVVGSAAVGKLGSAYRRGLLTNLSNPKALVYFIAVIGPILPSAPPLWLQFGLIAALLGSALVWFSAIALTVSTERMRRQMLRAGPWFDIVAGVVFIVFSLALLVEVAHTITSHVVA